MASASAVVNMIPVGTSIFVRADKKEAFGYFPAFVAHYVFGEDGSPSEVLMVYEPLPDSTEWTCCLLDFPLNQDFHYISGGSNYAYADLPAFDCQLRDGRYHVFVLRGLGDVVQCGNFARRPSKKNLAKFKENNKLVPVLALAPEPIQTVQEVAQEATPVSEQAQEAQEVEHHIPDDGSVGAHDYHEGEEDDKDDDIHSYSNFGDNDTADHEESEEEPVEEPEVDEITTPAYPVQVVQVAQVPEEDVVDLCSDSDSDSGSDADSDGYLFSDSSDEEEEEEEEKDDEDDYPVEVPELYVRSTAEIDAESPSPPELFTDKELFLESYGGVLTNMLAKLYPKEEARQRADERVTMMVEKNKKRIRDYHLERSKRIRMGAMVATAAAAASTAASAPTASMSISAGKLDGPKNVYDELTRFFRQSLGNVQAVSQ